MSNILGLDLGNKLGWSVFNKYGYHANSGVRDFSKTKDAGEKWWEVKFELEYLIDNYRPSFIYYEEAKRHLGIYAAHSFGGFKAMLYLSQFKVTPIVKQIIKLSPTHIKKVATGKGNANKKMMVISAEDHWPEINIIDDNHADALWIGYIGVTEKQLKELQEESNERT